MRKTIMSLLGLFIILATMGHTQETERFYNEKYNYHVDYPKGSLKVIDTEDGAFLINPKLGINIQLTAVGIEDVETYDLTDVYNMEVAELSTYDNQVNFFALNNQRSWYAISGQNGTKLFMRKRALALCPEEIGMRICVIGYSLNIYNKNIDNATSEEYAQIDAITDAIVFSFGNK